jgi:hypothetical protein
MIKNKQNFVLAYFVIIDKCISRYVLQQNQPILDPTPFFFIVHIVRQFLFRITKNGFDDVVIKHGTMCMHGQWQLSLSKLVLWKAEIWGEANMFVIMIRIYQIA